MSTLNSSERFIPFDGVINFRDLGGYQVPDGRAIKRRTIYRSGELHKMTEEDVAHALEQLKLTTVLDLRNTEELDESGIGPLSETEISHQSIPFSGSRKETAEMLEKASYMGELYLSLLQRPGFGKRLLDALTLIAEVDTHPLVFHCTAGKDRTGILAGILLGSLGVEDSVIIDDYALSDDPMKELEARMLADPARSQRYKTIPRHAFRAVPESMSLLLSTLRDEYGSIRGYVQVQGGNESLFTRLECALLS